MPRRRVPPSCRTALLALGAFFSGSALAQSSQTSSPYFIGVSQTLSQETNLLRLADGQNAPAGYSRNDTVSSTALLAGFDQPIGRQRLFGNVNVRDNRYSENKLFDNQSYSASAGLEWSTVGRTSGNVVANASRSLQRFGDTQEVGFITQKNLETSAVVSASVSVGVVTQYTLEFNATRREVSNSLEEQNVQAREFSQDAASAGLRWRPSNVASLGVSLGHSRGRYPKFRIGPTGAYQPDRFTRNDVTLSGMLRPSGASTIEARLSSNRTEYDLNEQRSFSGVTGNIGWTWQATGKLRLNAMLARDTGQDSYAINAFGSPTTSDYSRVNSVLRLQADHDFSVKIAFTSSLAYYERSVVRTVGNPQLAPEASGRDRTTTASFGARWAPLRSVLVGCDLNTERRRASGQLVVNLSNTGFACYGQLSLQ